MQRSAQRRRISRAAYRARGGRSRGAAGRYARRGAIRGRRYIPGFDRRGGFYGRYGQVGGEKKFFDTVIDDAVVSANMTINNLTIIPEGNGESARIGRKITLKSAHMKGTITLTAATAAVNTSDTVTCMVVQDTQTNGQQFAATDLLTTDSFDSFRNLAESVRFKVLYKKIYNLKSSGAAASGAAFVFGEDVRSFAVNVPMNIVMQYNDDTTDGAIGTVRTNNLYWVTQASTGVTSIIGEARVRYSDK